MIPVVRHRPDGAIDEIAFGTRGGKQRAERAWRFAFRSLPEQSVLAALRADEAARIVQQRSTFGIPPVVLALRIHVRERRLNRRELVLADAPIQDLLDAVRGVEAPTAAFIDERERKRPVVGADDERGDVGSFAFPTVRVGVRGDELVAGVRIRDRIPGVHERFGVFAEHAQHRARVAGRCTAASSASLA